MHKSPTIIDYIERNPNWEFVAVYSDIASGVRTANRPGHRQLMRNCAKGKVDLILVKSLSRFGRDALETIRQVRKLKRANIGIYIEIGGLNALNISDSMIDQLAALDQAESHFRSENIKFVSAPFENVDFRRNGVSFLTGQHTGVIQP